jgi:hypothetical protein
MHCIEIDIPDHLNVYVQQLLDKANDHNVKVWLCKDALVPCNDGSMCNGYFIDEPHPILAVACGQPSLSWFQVLLHEGSHMDQWIEKSPYWDAGKVLGVEAISIIELWVQGFIELTEENKWDIFRAARNVELDCERRTLAKIQAGQFKVEGLTADGYARRGNAYILYYNMLGQSRTWYNPGSEPYNMEQVYKVMPPLFYGDDWYEPNNVPTFIMKALEQCLPKYLK